MNEAHAFEQSVLGTIRTHGIFAPGDRVVVAVSGGADSTALLATLTALVRRGALDLALTVAHLNHRMRGVASDRDATFVGELADRFGLPFFLGTSDALSAVRANREAAARDERHAFLARVARQWGASHTALAHTRDDQAETVLLRLARGAGPASLAGMRMVRDDGVVRPFLDQPRAACVGYLRDREIGWIEDESNADESYFRNRVRRRLLPLLDAELGVDVRSRLARLAEQLREESALAGQRIDDLLADAADDTALSIATVRRAGGGAARLLHAWLARAGVRANARQIGMLARVAAGEDPSAEVALAGGRCVRRSYERLLLAEPHDLAAVAAAEAELDVPGTSSIPGWRVDAELAEPPDSNDSRRATSNRSCFDGDLVGAPLWIRPPRAGDRVRLSYGRRKLADILIDAKIPRHERTGLAVIGCGADVLWVPGIVRSVVADASHATRRCVILRAERTATTR
jgi:tRNA(Ile)-lysidine synthase